MRVFQFDPQTVEPLPTAFEPLAVGGQRLFTAAEFRLACLAVDLPRGPVHIQGLRSVGQVGLESLFALDNESVFPCERLFAFFQERAGVCQLFPPQTHAGFPLLEVGPIGLVLFAELLLGGLDLLPSLLQVILLETDAVFEEFALLLEPGKLFAVLLFQPLLLVP